MRSYEEIIEELFNLCDTLIYIGCLTDKEERQVADLMREYYIQKETER